MTYYVTDDCIDCKDLGCVEVCPVDAFADIGNMLVIGPDICIDCGVCEPECPASAIFPDSVANTLALDKNALLYSTGKPLP